MSLTARVTHDRDDEIVWSEEGEEETYGNADRRRINWKDRDPDWADVKGFRGPKNVDSPGRQWTRIDVDSFREFGRRYGAAMRKLQERPASKN
jgi:hypothetical protein